MKMKSTEIIAKREKINKSLKRNWGIIRSENVVDKNYTRSYDMKNLLASIEADAIERINTKLDSICINLGYAKRSDLPATSIFPTIYELSEKNEMFVQLGLIPTLDLKKKAAKGKKNLKETEELTSDYIKKLRDKLQLEINSLRKKLEDFNNNASLDIASAYMFLAV